jgi:hypothetical protein
MSCNTCNKVIDPNMNGLKYSFIGEPVLSISGLPIMKPMFGPARAPRGGWFFDIYLIGHSRRISGNTPRVVALEVMRLLDLNKLLYTPAQLWLNLNIQWVERAYEKHRIIDLSDLLAIAIPNF